MDRLNKLNLKYPLLWFHIVFWISFLFYPYIKFGDQAWYKFEPEVILINTFLLGLSVFYSLYILIFKKKRGLQILLFLFVFALLIYFNCYLCDMLCECNMRLCYLNKAIEYVFTNVVFLAVHTTDKNIKNQRNLEKIKKNQIEAELKSLKAQLNPHFLFNTLTMLYSNAIKIDEGLANKILKLSDSLHYLLHEGDNSLVAISQEIKFIQGYVELQKARIGDRVSIQFNTDIDDMDEKIPPLLMIPLIENAFKYSSQVDDKNNPILIDIVLKDKKLNLYVENDFIDKEEGGYWKDSGIGITNLKRRLTLLFESKYSLELLTKRNSFIVDLKINLK
jgi:sensor histidine kinase YesM